MTNMKPTINNIITREVSINISPTLTYNNYNVYVFNSSQTIQLSNVN
jgi:hypothetical protein